MPDRYDAIVIGLGALGSSACFHLARRGARVLGLEQFGIPHALGSHHGDSRMIRLCYAEHPDYVPLLRRAYDLWQELEQLSRRRLLQITGGVYIGAPGSRFVGGARASAEEHRLPHEMLDFGALSRRWPQFRPPRDAIALAEPLAGLLLAERTVGAQAEQALRHGAELHGQEPVLEWGDEGSEVRVESARGSYRGGALCICGGAWSERLLGDLGVPLCVTRQAVAWFWPLTPEAFAPPRFPVWAIEENDGGLYYGFPLLEERPGLKLGRHAPGPITTAGEIDRMPRPEDEQELRPVLSRWLPDAGGPLLSMQICMYTNTPDGDFIVDRHPRHERIFFACGTSGHGFKFASVLGEVLADLVLERATRHPVAFLGLGRFARGSTPPLPG